MASSVFISYSHKDKLFAYNLKRDLEMMGVKVWIDESELKAGDLWENKIREEIERTDYFFIIISPSSLKSKHVKSELKLAQDKKYKKASNRVIPLLKQKCDIPDNHPLKNLHWIDVTDISKYIKNVDKIFESIDLIGPRKTLEVQMNYFAEEIGLTYQADYKYPSINGLIFLKDKSSVIRDVPYQIGVKLIESSGFAKYAKEDNNFLHLKLKKEDIINWQSFPFPVIVILFNKKYDSQHLEILWANTRLANHNTEVIKVNKKDIFISPSTSEKLLEIAKLQAGKPDFAILTKNSILPLKVSEVKRKAWKFYSKWRVKGSKSPIFGKVDITLKGWRHITQVSKSQQAVSHRLLLLPGAKNLIEVVKKSNCVRKIKVHNVEKGNIERELHAIRGIYRSNYQADIIIEVILEVTKLDDLVKNTKLYSFYEKRKLY